ncbi:MAG: pyridoxal phosphate-dependent aminotransferase [bacterium]|nr:pyridoxal phosphate-dependent aminotransferase [bacterium]
MDVNEKFVKWQPSPLMEWAKESHPADALSLAVSGVSSIKDIGEIPGGPFEARVWGRNYFGHEGLKTRIAAMYGAAPENILIAQGASQCNFLMAGALLAGGGTAIVETPVYEPILQAVEVWADRVIRLPRRKENGFQPDPDELRALLTKNTRLIALTDLHNPTQTALDAERRTAIIAVARAAGARVMIDEVFLPMIRRDHRTHGYADGAISNNGLDKSWGLDALRIGWAVGPADVVNRAYRLNNLLGVNQPFLTEDLADRILGSEHAVKWMIARADQAARTGRALFDEFVSATPEAACIPIPGGINAVVELPRGTDDRKFAERLLAEENTIVFPGSFFEYSGALRVSFGGIETTTREGLQRLSRRIKTWR